jgi:uncharacterized protein
MRFPLILAATLLAAVPLAGAQAPAPASASSPAKKELVQKILQLQQPGVEAMARQLVEAPVARLMQQAGPVLQQKIAADKREAVAQEIQADARKYVDEVTPFMRDRAVKLAPGTIGVVLEEKMSEDELRQVIAALESPGFKKYNTLTNEMQRTFGEKLFADTRGTIEPKIQALQQSIARRLGVPPAPASAASGAKKK